MLSEILSKSLVVMPATLAMALLISTEANANQIPSNIENQLENRQNISPSQFSNFEPEFNSISELSSLEENPLDQVTSVSQLSDVQPTDWAFQALQSLVERYGCIAGYPDGTYRGNRAITRYEFAAGLNACLERINEIIASNTSNLAKKEDLIALQKLQEEFAAELATLRGRVDALESRTSELEANQFSTTTKLNGRLITYFGDAFGENAGPANSATMSYLSRLSLVTSFTGKDSLTIALQALNVKPFDTATDFPSAKLSGPTDETRLLPLNGNGNITLSTLQYSFPVGDKLFVYVDAYNSNRKLSASINQASNNKTGFVSAYGRTNPLTAPNSLESGVGVSWNISPWFNLDISAGSEFGSGSNPTKGAFNGGYGITIRPVIKLGRLNLTAFYLHTYSPNFGIDTGTGSNASKMYGVGPVVANTYVGGISYLITPTIDVGGSIGYANARALGSGTRGDADVWTYNLGVSFYDLGKKGNTAGFLVGMQPRLTGTSNRALAAGIGLPAGQRKDRDTGYHFEAYYAHRLTDNIIITPAFIWLTAPNHDARNPDVFLGVIRTTIDF
jgi:hypothetical protein